MIKLFFLISRVYLSDSRNLNVNESYVTTIKETNICKRPSVIQSCGNPKPLYTPCIYIEDRELQKNAIGQRDLRKRAHSERESEEKLCDDVEEENSNNESNSEEENGKQSSEDAEERCSGKKSHNNQKKRMIRTNIDKRHRKICDVLSHMWNCRVELVSADKQSTKGNNNIRSYLITMKKELTNVSKIMNHGTNMAYKSKKPGKNELNLELVLNNIQFCKNNSMYMKQFIETLDKISTLSASKYYNVIRELQQLLSDHIVTHMVDCIGIANRTTIDEIREFVIEKAISNNFHVLLESSRSLNVQFRNLFATSLQMMFGTRIIEKIIFLPEFVCIYDHFIKYCGTFSRSVMYKRIITVYIINKFEVFLSAYIELKDQTSNPSLKTENNTRVIAYFRLFIRETLFIHLFLTFKTPKRVYAKYLFFAELEYIFLVSNDNNTLRNTECVPVNLYDFLFFVIFEWSVPVKLCWKILRLELAENVTLKSFGDEKIVGRVFNLNYSNIRCTMVQSIDKLCGYLESYLSINLPEMRSGLLDKLKKLDDDAGNKLQHALSFFMKVRKHLEELNRPVNNTETSAEGS